MVVMETLIVAAACCVGATAIMYGVSLELIMNNFKNRFSKSSKKNSNMSRYTEEEQTTIKEVKKNVMEFDENEENMVFHYVS